MSTTATVNGTARELARGLSLFEIDQALAMLIESAQEEAAASNGELSEELKAALANYIEGFGEKVDRIANYLKAQERETPVGRPAFEPSSQAGLRCPSLHSPHNSPRASHHLRPPSRGSGAPALYNGSDGCPNPRGECPLLRRSPKNPAIYFPAPQTFAGI